MGSGLLDSESGWKEDFMFSVVQELLLSFMYSWPVEGLGVQCWREVTRQRTVLPAPLLLLVTGCVLHPEGCEIQPLTYRSSMVTVTTVSGSVGNVASWD